MADPDTSINKRDEFVNKCRHNNKFLLQNFKSNHKVDVLAHTIMRQDQQKKCFVKLHKLEPDDIIKSCYVKLKKIKPVNEEKKSKEPVRRSQRRKYNVANKPGNEDFLWE